MTEIQVGMLAKSIAGRDKDSIYVIIKMDTEYVYLVDGKYKLLDKPKKKKKKHIQIIHSIPKNYLSLKKEGKVIQDEHIKRMIHLYRNR
ncbi:MAG TPA: 50S ribosomal protein L14 [Candidatus Merdenecus merdavium]|nr:50S ribosomal protein L14 [Candidatus Merdenecus merdavium]